MKNKVVACSLIIGAGLAAWAAKDPVLMKVNGVDVPKSEFEYLYHKNSQQQLTPQPLEEYVEMFKIYKLKVADAIANGIDTTASFRKEMQQYRRDLAAPYVADSAYLDAFVREAAERAKTDAEAYHIMILKGQSPAQEEAAKARLDSIRTLLVNGADFARLAAENSDDRSAKSNGGYLGYISTGRYPYNFESAAYTLGEGEYSGIVESPVAFHVLKGGKKRPSRGSVLASHILILCPQTASPEEQAAAKNKIDSIAALAKANPARFADLARELSDDKGSARNGGELPWFTTGMMVPEFEASAFALGVNEISDPVRTSYGWHVIQKRGEKGPESYAEIKPGLLKRLTSPQDDRYMMIRKHTTDRLAAKHKGKLNRRNIDAMIASVPETGIDSVWYAKTRADMGNLSLGSIGKDQLTVNKFLDAFRNKPLADQARCRKVLDNYVDYFFYSELNETEDNWLEKNEPDYRNLLNEYRDGSLLYEISVREVWDKASKDTDGLKKFFEAHRGDYAWKEPHVKGLLVQAANDSVAALVRARMDSLSKDDYITAIRKDFGKQVSIDKVLCAKGKNAMVDNLMFGGPKVNPSNEAFTTYFLYNPVLIEVPEEVADVRGLVTSDYQTELETAWVEKLKAKYPVEVYEKVLRKVK